jgi:hypothetical protein
MSAKTSAAKLNAFLAQLADGHAVKNACKTAGIGRTTAYDLRDADEAFAARWREAEAEGVEVLEQEAFRRAVQGIDKPIVFQGVVTDTVREYSDTLLIFLLKAKRPGVYREHFRHEVTGADGGPIEVEVAQVRERLTSRLADRASRKRQT